MKNIEFLKYGLELLNQEYNGDIELMKEEFKIPHKKGVMTE